MTQKERERAPLTLGLFSLGIQLGPGSQLLRGGNGEARPPVVFITVRRSVRVPSDQAKRLGKAPA